MLRMVRQIINKKINRLHLENGRIVDRMNEGKISIYMAKELLKINANIIDHLNKQT